MSAAHADSTGSPYQSLALRRRDHHFRYDAGRPGEWMIDRRPGYRELPPFHTTNSENMS